MSIRNNKIKIACIQLNSKSNINKNLKKIEKLIHSAVKKGADLIATPENSNIMHPNKDALIEACSSNDNSIFLASIKDIAKTKSVWILIGSIIVKHSKNRLMNRSYLINSKGLVVAEYNKIHMFDVTLSDKESYKESRLYEKGRSLVTVKTPWAVVGLSICYDLRFPLMYRKLAQAGSSIIFIPSAFTKTTGKAHWLTLLKARAIENGCFIVAPAQFGQHYKGRNTFGHSVIISPWGKIIKNKKNGIGIILAELDLKEVESSRKSIPSLKIDNKF